MVLHAAVVCCCGNGSAADMAIKTASVHTHDVLCNPQTNSLAVLGGVHSPGKACNSAVCLRPLPASGIGVVVKIKSHLCLP